MIKVSAEQMKELDRRAQDEFGIPGLILMENAGLHAGEIAFELMRGQKNRKVMIFCGPGNNGGDGFVLARHLINNRVSVKVFLLSRKSKIKGDAFINFNILLKMGAPVKEILNAGNLRRIKSELKSAGLIVDAIFGIGLNKNISGIYADIIKLINLQNNTVLSLDTPSGLCAATGRVFGVCVKAKTTVSFGVAKKGFFIRKGPAQVGRLIVVDISLPRTLLSKFKSRL